MPPPPPPTTSSALPLLAVAAACSLGGIAFVIAVVAGARRLLRGTHAT